MQILNETNVGPVEFIKPGTICMYIDNDDNTELCTVKYVELSSTVHDLIFYYLIANDESLNVLTDPRFPWPYYKLTDNTDQGLIPVAQATTL